ncbi:MAG: tetratricopeptide repeat protein [Ignavibacteria bacterium]|nr:tetratricopeptide repeat protein [Ignavibacteria bacterium]
MNDETLNNLLAKANECNNTGNYDEAETLVGVLLAELEKIGESTDTVIARQSDTINCEALITLSVAKWRRGVLEKALGLARAALDLTEKKNLPDKTNANAFDNIAIVYANLSDYPQALTYFQKALAINEESGSNEGIARNLGNIGIVNQDLSDYPLALTYYQKALTIYEETGSKDGISINLGNIGNVYLNLSDYPRALIYYQKALDISEEIGSKDGIASNLGNIGIIYQDLSDYPQALTYYQKALAIYEELSSKDGSARNLGNIGLVYQYLSDYPQALTYYQKAIAINEEIGSKDGIAHNLGNIGNVYANLSDSPQAFTYYQKALALFEEMGHKDGIATNLGNIGGLYANKEFDGYDTDKAEEFFLSALAIFEDIGAKKNLYEVHKYLAELYETQERWKEHSIQFKKFYTLEKEVQSEDVHKQAGLMEQRRQAAEREKEIAIAHAAANARHEATVQLLHNVLPPSIADKMLGGTKLIAEKLPSVSVMFADIVNFTKLSQRITPEELVEGLDRIFSTFDALAEKHGLEKIKTIGDAYMVVSGAPVQREDHAEAMAHFALEMMDAMKEFRSMSTGEEIQLRIGIHSGEVVAGVIGKKKFAYDLWGDAVNTASRMESHGEEDKIHVSEDFKHAVETQNIASLQFIERGEMEIKGKGLMKTYYLQKATL